MATQAVELARLDAAWGLKYDEALRRVRALETGFQSERDHVKRLEDGIRWVLEWEADTDGFRWSQSRLRNALERNT